MTLLYQNRVYFLLLHFLFLSVIALPADNDIQYQDLKKLTQKWQGVRLDSSLYFAKEMRHLADSLHDHEKIAESILMQGLAYGFMDDFENEIKYYKQALTYTTQHHDSLGMGKCYINMGVNNYYKGLLDSAAIYYEQARKIFFLIGEEKFLGFSLNNLGQVYTRVEKFEQAKEVYNEALRIKKSVGDTIAIMNTYFNLASLCVSQKSFEEAKDYSIKTLQFAEYVGDSMTIGAAYINLGLSTSRLGEVDEALSYLEMADRFENALKKDIELLLDLHSLATELYKEKGQLVIARNRLIKMKNLLRDDAFSEAQMRYYQLKYELDQEAGDYKNALSSLQSYHRVKEEFVSESVQKNISELEKKYETEQNERIITELELDQKNAALALANSQNQRNVFISGFTVLIIFIGFLYHRYTTKKKTSELLTEKNVEITKALEDREILLKEIHHRVKNNLQIISSLLNLQAGSLDDAAAKDAVREGQSRVKSMALIHQKLYSTDDVRGVNVQEYLENLSTELFNAFGVNEEKVNWKIDASGLKMDIDTVIPLGLIINELITNSIKYAFQNVEHGLLDISLKENGENLNVIVKDNGSGMDEDALKTSNSFGWKMIKSLSRKLKAEINVKNEQGTTVHLTLSRYKLVV